MNAIRNYRNEVEMQKTKAALVVVVILSLAPGAYPVAPVEASSANLAAASTAPAPSTSALVAPSWPKTFEKDGNQIIVYQPQLKSWEKYRTLVADTAISITPAGEIG